MTTIPREGQKRENGPTLATMSELKTNLGLGFLSEIYITYNIYIVFKTCFSSSYFYLVLVYAACLPPPLIKGFGLLFFVYPRLYVFEVCSFVYPRLYV